MIMVLSVIEIQHTDTIHFFHLIRQLLCLIKSHITDQDPRGTVGRKL